MLAIFDRQCKDDVQIPDVFSWPEGQNRLGERERNMVNNIDIDIKTIQCKTVVLWGLVGAKKEIDKAIDHANVTGVTEVKSLLRATQI